MVSDAAAPTSDPPKELAELSEADIYHSLRGRSCQAEAAKPKKFDPKLALPHVYSEHPLQPARNPPKESLFDYLPFLRIFKPLTRPFRRRAPSPPPLPTSATGATRSLTGKRLRPEAVDSNVPLEISLFLSSYLAWLMRNGQLQPATASAFTAGIAQLQDTVTNLDRIRNTPLPFAYQAHLRISLWMYLFFLPVSCSLFLTWTSLIVACFVHSSRSGVHSSTSLFRTFLNCGWSVAWKHTLTRALRATAFASFLLLGFLEIGQEMYVLNLQRLDLILC